MPLKPWKTRKSAESLAITIGSGDKPRRLGTGRYGSVFLAKLKLKGKKPKRVAVKKINPHGLIATARRKNLEIGAESPKYGPLTKQEALRYQRVIDALRRAGVSLPKIGVYQVTAEDARLSKDLLEEGEWVIVSKLFGSTKKGSSIGRASENAVKWRMPLAKKKILMTDIVRMANARFMPAGDVLTFYNDGKGGFIFDLDVPALANQHYGLESRSSGIIKWIEKFSDNHFQAQVLFNLAFKAASPELKKLLKEYRPIERHVWDGQFKTHSEEVFSALEAAEKPLTFAELQEKSRLTDRELRTVLRHLGVHGRTSWRKTVEKLPVPKHIRVVFNKGTNKYELVKV